MTQPLDFKEEIANFIFTSKYSRYNEDKQRRETWIETVNRVEAMHLKQFRHLDKEYLDEIQWAFDLVREKKVVPSMRSLQFGGKAIEAVNSRQYNCSVRHVDSLRAFSEIFYLLLCGCGVGIGLSKFFLSRLPNLVSANDKTGAVLTYDVADSIEGWADSLEVLLMCYFKNTPLTGRKVVFDYSKIRPEGTPLKTSGGRAPGYKGLKQSHQRIKALLDDIIEVQGKNRLEPIHAYDILMHASDAVLSGGIRRSATIVIFDKDDDAMMNAKTFFVVDKVTRFALDDDTNKYHGKVRINHRTYDVALPDAEYQELVKSKKISWVHIEPQRARSNNSALFLRSEVTLQDFQKIIEKSRQFGEPGFAFANHPWTLYNPCCEIGFVPVTDDGICGVQYCNLSSINGAKIQTKEDFITASKAASIIGTLQAAYTDFKYFHPVTKRLTEEESLLGVSITGMMDNPKVLLNADYQQEAAHKAVVTNKKWAKLLNIHEAARVTCVKPEGTSSLVLGSASGIHPHHARRYFRRVQCNRIEYPFQFFKKTNPHMAEPSQWAANNTDEILTFPIEISDKAMIKTDLTAIEHLKVVKTTQENWVLPGTSHTNKKNVTHNVSCTIVVKDNEWEDVVNFIYKNRDCFGAVSFIPFIGDKVYKQAPLEAIATPEDEVKWNEIVSKYQSVDYTKMKEVEDMTDMLAEQACAGGKCELQLDTVGV